MSKTREDILWEIEHFTKWAEYWTKMSEDHNKRAEDHTKEAEKAKQELKEFDELKEKGWWELKKN